MTPLLHAESFEFYVREIAKEMRNRFDQIDISRLHFEVSISGQTSTGELLIEFKLAEGFYGESVKAGSVQAVFDEYLRRKGWTAQNAPLCLPRVEDAEAKVLDAD